MTIDFVHHGDVGLAGAARLAPEAMPEFPGFEIGTLFLGGTGAIVAGCFCLLLRMDSER